MTDYLADYASYQGALTAADYKRAGFGIINLKTSHGMGLHAVHSRARDTAEEARSLGMGLGSFHWLTGDHDGATQAEWAYERLRACGLHRRAAHTVDVEEQDDADAERPPTWQHLAEYARLMTSLLHRPIMIYSAQWYWRPTGWDGASLTPYLMSAPDSGTGTAYPGKYPGDSSPLWNTTGWGGWKSLAVMQYAVGPLHYPGGTNSGTLKVSKSAIRSESVWTALTTEAA